LSPILVRPVREQLEHDRVIRLLQQDLQKRKVEVGINPGAEQNAAVGVGSRKEYPDAVVYSLEKGKKVVGVDEDETSESVNHLEAMAQWAHLAKLRVPFHLYVPMNSVDVARRLSNDYKIAVTEIWSYHQVGEQFRFTLIHPTGSRGGRGSHPPPRTVSVATIRVALPPEPEAPGAEEPQVQPGPTPAPVQPPKPPIKATGIKTIPARVAAPAATLPKPAGKGALAKVSRVVPVKVAGPAPIKPVASRTVPEKPAAAKPSQSKSAMAKPMAVKPANTAAAAKGAAVSKAAAARPPARPAKTLTKSGGKVAARGLPQRSAKGKTAPKATPTRSPAKAARPAKSVAKAVAKPAAKRK
jgi:hypothetical protein